MTAAIPQVPVPTARVGLITVETGKGGNDQLIAAAYLQLVEGEQLVIVHRYNCFSFSSCGVSISTS